MCWPTDYIHVYFFIYVNLKGGMKAVIWTDVFQAGVMVTGLIVVIIVGAIELDGEGMFGF